MKKAYHGGAFFDAVGNNFQSLKEDSQSVIKADVLDGWFPPAPRAVSKIVENIEYVINTSPPTHATGLIEIIAEVRNLPKENIVMNGGSSDLMFTLFPSLISEDDTVLILDPMYGEYQHIFENLIECKTVRHTLQKQEDFNVNVDELLNTYNETSPSLVVLVNPNSPTGKYSSREDIIRFIDNVRPETTVVIDETYIEYVGEHLSLEAEVLHRPNVVIIKSMSKTYGLSGVRVGYLVASLPIVEKVSSVTPPWSVSLPGQIAAVEALKDPAYYQMQYEKTHELRDWMYKELETSDKIRVYESSCNFLLIELLDEDLSAEKICSTLRSKNIFIRNCDSMSNQFKDNFIRIAVVNEESLKKVVQAFTELLN